MESNELNITYFIRYFEKDLNFLIRILNFVVREYLASIFRKVSIIFFDCEFGITGGELLLNLGFDIEFVGKGFWGANLWIGYRGVSIGLLWLILVSSSSEYNNSKLFSLFVTTVDSFCDSFGKKGSTTIWNKSSIIWGSTCEMNLFGIPR